jgi:integrase
MMKPKRFTDLTLKNLKADDMRREVPIGNGLYVIVQPSGRKSFAVRYRFDGTPRKLTLPGGLTLAAARSCASDALLNLEKGIDPASAKKETRAKIKAAKADTVQALCENYLKREVAKLRTGAERKRTLERLVFPTLGDVPLADLKRSDIVRLLDKIEDENGTKMADLTLAYLRKIFNWHASRSDDFLSPVVRSMNRYNAKEHEGTRVLADDELRRIWLATEAPEPFNALVRFLLLTGARRNEARKAKWHEIVDGNWTLPADRNKVKVDLTRPLSRAARRVLETVPRIDGSDLVFTNDGVRPVALPRRTLRLKKATGTTGWRVHDLRRTCRTLLSRAGVPENHAERCLGHVIGGVKGIYDKHRYEKEMLAAYEKLAGLIANIVHPVATNVTLLRKR